MNWVSLAIAVVKFLLSELPDFLKQYRLFLKDKKYKKNCEKFDAALKKYKESKSPKDLNELAK